MRGDGSLPRYTSSARAAVLSARGLRGFPSVCSPFSLTGPRARRFLPPYRLALPVLVPGLHGPIIPTSLCPLASTPCWTDPTVPSSVPVQRRQVGKRWSGQGPGPGARGRSGGAQEAPEPRRGRRGGRGLRRPGHGREARCQCWGRLPVAGPVIDPGSTVLTAGAGPRQAWGPRGRFRLGQAGGQETALAPTWVSSGRVVPGRDQAEGLRAVASGQARRESRGDRYVTRNGQSPRSGRSHETLATPFANVCLSSVLVVLSGKLEKADPGVHLRWKAFRLEGVRCARTQLGACPGRRVCLRENQVCCGEQEDEATLWWSHRLLQVGSLARPLKSSQWTETSTKHKSLFVALL